MPIQAVSPQLTRGREDVNMPQEHSATCFQLNFKVKNAVMQGVTYRSAREAKDVDMPQLLGTLPSKLLLCRDIVVRLAKQLVVPQLLGKLPLICLPCTYSPVRDCTDTDADQPVVER